MRKVFVLLLTIAMMVGLMACGEKISSGTENASGDSLSSIQIDENKESSDSDNNGKVKYKEKNGTVYVNDEELTIDKLLELVKNAEKSRYSKYTKNHTDYYFDNDTRTFYWHNTSLDKTRACFAYDMLSQCYYRLEITDSQVYFDSCYRESYLYTSLFDYETRSIRDRKSATVAFELDEDYCKVTITAPSYDGDENCFGHFWINTKTNTLDKMTDFVKESRADEILEIDVVHTEELGLVDGEIYFPTTDYSGNVYKWYNADLQAEFDAILEKGTYIDKYDFWPMKEESNFASVGTADFPVEFDVENIKSVMLSNEYLLGRYQPEIEERVTDEDGKNRTILELKGLQDNYENFSVWITDYASENKTSIGVYFDNMPIYHTTQDNVLQVLTELLGEETANVLVYYPYTGKQFGVDDMYDAWFEVVGNPTITVSRNMNYQTRNGMPDFYSGSFGITIQK